MSIEQTTIDNLGFDISKNSNLLGRLKLPYKSFNFLSILSKQYGSKKYDSSKDIIELCQWIYTHNSDVRNIINRLSEYVITDIQIDDTSTNVDKDRQESLLNILNVINLKSKLVQIAKLYFATGNALLSVDMHFKKHLKCPKCAMTYNISRIPFEFNSKKITYSAKCVNTECNYMGVMTVMDIKYRRAENIELKIWDWHDIEFNHNPISNEYRYYYKIPTDLVAGLFNKEPDKFLLETTPHLILKELYTKKNITNRPNSTKHRTIGFPVGKIKHIKNDSVMSSVMGGWGEPLTIGVLQDTFFMQLLRQAQAVLLGDYIIPIRVVSPDPSAVNLMEISKFATEFDKLYAQFQKDPMQIMKTPFPIQYQTLTGEGKTLFLSNEMDYTRNAIRRGMGVPSELLDGGMTNYSAGSISLRMLENFFINFINSVMNDLVNNFIIPNICIALKMPTFKVNFSKFKTLDDVQQKQSKLNLYDRNLLSDTDIYNDFEMPRPTEKELLESIERKGRRDGKYQLILAKYNTEGQTDNMIKATQAQLQGQEIQQKEMAVQANKNEGQMSPGQGDPKDSGSQEQKSEPGKIDNFEGLQPPDKIGDYALTQLQTPEELNSFMDVLSKQYNNNKPYVEAIGNYIKAHSPLVNNGGGSSPDNNVTNEDTRPREADGKVDMRPDSKIKPPRRK